jgi:hypothetical protein
VDGLLNGLRLLAAAVVVLLQASCSAGHRTVCPAIGWSDALTVALDAGPPAVPGGSVTVGCPSTCALEFRQDAPAVEHDELTVPLAGATTTIPFTTGRPGSVVVTVTAGDGTQLARHEAELDWRRVGGSEECGGPHEATVVVPSP